LFALIGLTVKLSGNTPLVSSILLLGRAAASMLFTGTVNMLMGFDSHTAFIVTLFGQSAVSMLGYGILSRVVDNQSKETPAMSKQFAFDLVGYSFPLSIVLNTTACIAKDSYVKRLIPMGGGLLAAVLVVFLATKKKVQDKQTWMTSLAQEREA
jgi:glucan phosphoethanolaminetransferase (alkaline phosphatase superfamily)